MREKIKIGIIVIVVVIVSLIIINVVESSHGEKLEGKLSVWVADNNYEYIQSAAQGFMEKHKDVDITIKKLGSNSYNSIVEAIKSGNEPDITMMNSTDLYNLINKNKIYPVDLGGIISSYNMNFAENRLQQVHFDKKYYGVPFTSTPLVLFVRNDLLSQYGFNNSDINTWADVFNIGEKIFKESNGKVRLFSGIGEDYKNLENLILLENMQEGLSEKQIIDNVNKLMTDLKNNNIIAMAKGEEYAAKIGSINSMKQLEGIKENCMWTANNPPALLTGSNKFYEESGENLVSLNEKTKNLSSAFISYISNDTKLSLEYTLSGQQFSSYLYTYRSIDIENKINNFSGKPPLVVMSNIEKNAPLNVDYPLYMKICEELNLNS